ncbi:hypothetical protein K435DRAFT_877139 [Dendrothele bispora CBS 962.96]|uniref:Uncharacterized protein n=1 Tax=Dendrothele bispora (strain CBS 962.96) TaxID=1314807 RepID=A0A4S8KQT6_DENBC|nr:hypothetical protein K435DRAFT_877139 [Dendrothele bispora CBS 962.96]
MDSFMLIPLYNPQLVFQRDDLAHGNETGGSSTLRRQTWSFLDIKRRKERQWLSALHHYRPNKLSAEFFVIRAGPNVRGALAWWPSCHWVKKGRTRACTVVVNGSNQ